MRRGCRVLFVHFHSYPILSRASQEKVRELAQARWRASSSDRGCSSCRSARSSSASCSPSPPPLRVVIYRRLMMRIAERIARTASRPGARHRRVVGQVASQTLENMATIGERRRRCRCCGRWSAWTRKKSPRRRSGSAPTRSRSFPTRTAARSSRPSIRRRRRDRATSTRAEAALPIDEIVGAGRRVRGRGDSSRSRKMIAMIGSIQSPDPRSPNHQIRRNCHREMTPGKLAGMKAVSDERGVIAAAAMDQRGSLQKALAKERGGDVGDRDLEEFKIARHRGADAARQRDPAGSRVGHSRRASAARRTRAC